MRQLIKSDFYKLRKAKSFWICMLIAAVLAVFSVFIMDFSVKITEQFPQQGVQQEAMLEESGLNVSTEGIPMSSDSLSGSSMLLLQFANNTTLLIAIVVSLFVGSEFSTGTIKNLVSKNYSRTQIYLSKLAVSVIVAFVMTIFYALIATALGTALWGFGETNADFMANACKGILLELLLTAAFVSLFVMFSMLIRHGGGAIAASICFLEFFSLAFMIVEMVINKIFDTSIVFSNYLIDTNMTQIATQEITGKLAGRSICVALAFFLVSLAIGLFSLQKRDIK